jgi:hypothetical protein
MTFAPSYVASTRFEKDGHQELRSTPYKREIDPWSKGNVGFKYVNILGLCSYPFR